MEDISRVVENALEYMDDNTIKNYDKLQTFRYYNIYDDGKIFFFNTEKKLIYKSSYEVIGKYVPSQNIWIWGWAAAELDKNTIRNSRKVLNYALDLDNKNISMKTALITSRHQITSLVQIDMDVALTTFLSKQNFVFKLNYYGDRVGIDYPDSESKSVRLFKISHKKNPISIYYMALINLEKVTE